VRWILWSTVSVVEDQLLYACGRDITDRKKIEQELKTRTDQFECLINAAPFGIHMMDDNFTVRLVNPYALQSFGNISDLIGRDFGEVMQTIWPAPKAEEIIKMFRHTLETGESCVAPEMIEQRADREVTEYYAWEIHRIPLPNGKQGVVCYFQDISQRVLAQQKICDSEWRLRYATESAKLTFVEVDLASGAAHTPENFANVMGYAPPIEQETNGSIGVQALLEHVVPDDRRVVKTALKQFFNGQPIGKIDYRVLGDDHIERWIESKWTIELSKDGKPIKAFATNLNISDRKRAEIAKSIIEERYHSLFNSIEEGFCILEKVKTAVGEPLDFRYIEVNPAFELQAGIANVAGKTIRQIFPDKSEDWYLTYDTVIRTGKPIRFERELLPDRRMLELYAFRIEDNTHLRVAVIFKDVTQRKRIEGNLRHSEEQFRLLADSTPVLIWLSGTDKLCTWFNKTWLNFTGRSMAQEMGNGWTEGIHPDDFERCLQIYTEAFVARESFSMEYRLKRHDGEYRWILDVGVPRHADGVEFLGYIGSCTDISEVKHAESALVASEERYHTLFNCMDEGYCVVEIIFDANKKPIDYRFFEVNRPFEEQSGLVNAIGKTILELIPDFDPILIAMYGQVAITGEPIRFEYDVKELDRWFDLYAFRIKSADNSKIAILFTNITQRKLAQLALIENQERLEAFIMSSSDVIYSMSADWSELKHLSGKDFVADSKKSNTNWLQEYIHPADQLAMQAKIAHAIQTKSIFDVEHQVIRIDYTLGWTYSRAVPLFNKQGDITEWFGTASDITDRKHAQKALRESEERFRILFELGPVAMYTVDAAGNIQEFNRNAVNMWGREPKRGDLCERYCGAYKIYSPDGALILHTENSVAAVLNGLVPIAQDVEAILERLDGSKVHVIANVVPLKNSSNEIIGALSCSVDITDRKKVEDVLYINNMELKDAKLAAEKANLAKSEFLSSMSHELRTPLNAILGFAQLLQISQPAISDMQQSNVKQILHGGWHLLELVNEILDLAQIESGQQNLVLEPVNIEQIMQECKDLLQQQAEQYEVNLQLKTLNCHLHILADKTRLKQIFINLLSNAIKYNKKGGTVTMDCSQKDDTLRINVKDTGDGLNSNELAQLFQPFNRLDKKFSAVEGTGIGLVVSKRLVELMQGTIGVQSTVGVGSDFWVEFKLLPNNALNIVP